MALVTREKIEEWIKEVEERPESAPLIIGFIARRVQELTQRNEQLLEENIALQSGKRVEEYERRVDYLEYQLDLLKRRLAGGLQSDKNQLVDDQGDESPTVLEKRVSVLVYSTSGQMFRVEMDRNDFSNGKLLQSLRADSGLGDTYRVLAVFSDEELLCMFSSGRISVIPVASIYSSRSGEDIDIRNMTIPAEPRAGEILACVTPISGLPLTNFIIQTSRRGYLKKINATLAESILANHYIGSGVKQAPDMTFSLFLAERDDRIVLLTREGFIQCLDVRTLPVTVEEALRMDVGDHLVSAIGIKKDQTLLALTQVGKIVQLNYDQLEVATSFKVKGGQLFSAKRRAQGVRVIGAAAVQNHDWGVVLDQDGRLTLYSVYEMLGAGTVPTDCHLLAFASYSG